MSSVAQFQLVLLLLAVAICLELLAQRVKMPTAAALILGGIALALVPGTPDITLDPDLALVLFLPPLLMSSAYFTVWRDFRDNLRIILQLAVGAVAFTTLAVGVAAHWIMPSLPWAACFALGAIVSPPDAVAAKAVLQRLPLPPRVVVLLEGESLVNDASGLVLFRVAVAAALTGAFDARQAVASFFVLAIGGVLTGVAFGFALVEVAKRLKAAELAIVTGLLAAWASYAGAEAIGVSGVLSTVACGLVLGWRQHETLSATTRTQTGAVWQVVVFVLESLVFILIGLSLRHILLRPGGMATLWTSLPGIGVALAAVIVSRFVWIFPATYLPRALIPALRRRDPYPPLAIPLVMSWAGMRGVVSLAAALTLRQNFPGHDFIVLATFAVILVTVLVQGATLAPLIRMFDLSSFTQQRTKTLSEAAARARMAKAQVAEVERRSLGPDGVERHPRLLEQYGYRARASERFDAANGGLLDARTEHFTVVLAANAAGRAEILRLHRAGQIHDRVLHALEGELDLEELLARRFLQLEET